MTDSRSAGLIIDEAMLVTKRIGSWLRTGQQKTVFMNGHWSIMTDAQIRTSKERCALREFQEGLIHLPFKTSTELREQHARV